MDKMIDVVVSGHLCIDIIPQMNGTPPSALNQPGRLYETGPMTIATGGAVANTGIALRRLGLDAHLMAMLGDDALATLIRETLMRDVPTTALHLTPRAGTPCSYSVVLSPKGTDRIFLHCTGTNALFSQMTSIITWWHRRGCFTWDIHRFCLRCAKRMEKD